jgi:hypothetical protein
VGYVHDIATSANVFLISICEIVTLICSSHCNVICSSLVVTLLCLIDCNITMFDTL